MQFNLKYGPDGRTWIEAGQIEADTNADAIAQIPAILAGLMEPGTSSFVWWSISRPVSPKMSFSRTDCQVIDA